MENQNNQYAILRSHVIFFSVSMYLSALKPHFYTSPYKDELISASDSEPQHIYSFYSTGSESSSYITSNQSHRSRQGEYIYFFVVAWHSWILSWCFDQRKGTLHRVLFEVCDAFRILATCRACRWISKGNCLAKSCEPQIVHMPVNSSCN